jgi:hypothetical protein
MSKLGEIIPKTIELNSVFCNEPNGFCAECGHHSCAGKATQSRQ